MWFVLYLVLSVFILVAFGIMLQLIADRVERKLRVRVPVSDPMPSWRKVRLAVLTIGLAVAPYVGLLVVSALVFSIVPLGAVPSGLVALLIFTFILYRFVRAVAFVSLSPDEPRTRLLPMRDSTAQKAWSWAVRLSILAAVYVLITRTLLTIGASHELYQVVRGFMLLVWAVVLSILITHLAPMWRPTVAAPPGDERHSRWTGVMTALQKAWPIIAIAYIWCVILLAFFSIQPGVVYIAAASLQMAMVIGAGLGLLWAGEHLFNKAAALSEQVGRYMPGLEIQTLRYLRALWWSLRGLIIVAAILIVLQVWGVDIAWFFTSPLGSDMLSRLITLLVTVAVVLFVIDLSTFMSQKLMEPTREGAEAGKKRKTLVPLTVTVIRYATLFTGGLVVLHLVGVNITPILAGVGILSLAVGFGAQTLVKDIINGLFILVEDSISVGDVVTIRGTGGAVEAVNLRTIRLRDQQGSVHIIPNSQVEIITNMTKDYAYYVLDVAVAYREDTDEVIAVLQEVDADIRADPAFTADMLAPIEILGVDSFTDSAVVVKARLLTKPIRQWYVGREFNRRMKKLFDARGIEIPFPHRTIYWGEPKRGEAPPLQLHIHNREVLATMAMQEEHPPSTPHVGKSDRS
jgi:small conductance mechanosensitive channel